MSRYIYIYDQHTYRMQADRQARKADTHTDTGKQAGKHRRAGKHAQRDWLDDWLTYIHIYIQTNKRMDRRTGGRTDGRTDEHTHTHTHTHRNTLLSPPQGYCFHGNQKLIDPVTFTLVMWRSRCAMAVLSRTSPKYLWRLFGSVQLTLCTKIGQKPLKPSLGYASLWSLAFGRLIDICIEFCLAVIRRLIIQLRKAAQFWIRVLDESLKADDQKLVCFWSLKTTSSWVDCCVSNPK